MNGRHADIGKPFRQGASRESRSEYHGYVRANALYFRGQLLARFHLPQYLTAVHLGADLIIV
jgi:hypothetical protein